jgi:hypothetical protein
MVNAQANLPQRICDVISRPCSVTQFVSGLSCVCACLNVYILVVVIEHVYVNTMYFNL